MINETGSVVVNINVPDEWLKIQWSRWEKLLSPGDSDHVMVPFLPDREFETGGIYTLLNFLASRLFGEGTRILMRMGEGGQAASGLFQVKDGRLREVRGLDFDVLIDFTPNSLFRLFSVSRDLEETSDPGMDVLFLLLEGMLSNPPEIRIECSGEFISMLPEEFLQAVSMLLDSRVQICGKGIVRKTKAFYPNAFRLHIDELPQWMEKLTFRLSRREFFKELSDLIISHIYLEHGRPELDEAQIEEAQRSLSIISEELGRLKEGVPPISASLSPPFSIREYPADKFLVLFHRLLPLILGDEGTLFIHCGGIDDFTGRYPAVLLLPFKKGWPGEPSVFRSSTPEWVELTAEQDDLPKPFMKIFLEGEEPGSYSLWGIFKSLTENGTSKLGRGWEFFRAGVILEDTLDIIPEDMFSFETVLEDDRLIIETAAGRVAVNYEVIYSFLSRLGSLEGPGAFQFLVEGLLKSAQPGWEGWLSGIKEVLLSYEEPVRILFCIEDRDFILTFDAGLLAEIREETSFLADVTDLGTKWKEACKKYGFIKLAVRPAANLSDLVHALFFKPHPGRGGRAGMERAFRIVEVYPDSAWLPGVPVKKFL